MTLGRRSRQREPSRTERRLAERLQRREPEALDEAYTEYGGTVFGMLVRTLGDRAAAEDVQQQVFLEVWQRGAQYDADRAGLLTWILTIARSRAIDHLRRRVPEPRDPAGAVALLEASGDGPDPLEEMLGDSRVAHLLRKLPSEEASLLRMRFFEDLSQREIAELSEIPLGTVKMRMVQALDRLRTMIEAEEAGTA